MPVESSIAPGPTDTEMGAPLKAGGVEARIPVGRMGEAEDVAQATVMVIGNSFITGQTLYVDGGLWTQVPWPYSGQK